MLLIPLTQVRRRRRTQAKPVKPFSLVSATYSLDGQPFVTLTFDRAVDISLINLSAFGLDVPEMGLRYLGNDKQQPSANVVQVYMGEAGVSTGSEITLSATADNGVVAVDGSTWAGVTGLVLPFP